MMRTPAPLIALGLLALAAHACKGDAAAPAAGATSLASTAQSPPAPARAPGGVPGDRSTCQAFADRVCEESAEDPNACGAARLTADILATSACVAAMASIDETIGRLKSDAPCDRLVERLCRDLGPDTESCTLVKERTPQFPVSQCRQMMGEYDKVLAELRAIAERNKPIAPDLQARLAAPGNPGFGPEDAKVVVVEFSDFECPYCSMAAASVEQLEASHGDKVRFVFRHFPLSFHPNAALAAEAAHEAHSQGKFWPFHDLLFDNQQALTRPDLERYAKDAGLDLPRFRKALDEGAHRDAVIADRALADAAHVEGTPSLFVGGQRVGNPSDVVGIRKLIDEALAAK